MILINKRNALQEKDWPACVAITALFVPILIALPEILTTGRMAAVVIYLVVNVMIVTLFAYYSVIALAIMTLFIWVVMAMDSGFAVSWWETITDVYVSGAMVILWIRTVRILYKNRTAGLNRDPQ